MHNHCLLLHSTPASSDTQVTYHWVARPVKISLSCRCFQDAGSVMCSVMQLWEEIID